MRGVSDRQHPQAARHAEMQDQRARFRFEQQVLGAAARATDCAAGDGRQHVRDPPASANGVRARAAGDAPPDDVRLDAAAGGLDFG